MLMSPEDSVTRGIRGMKAGAADAARPLWERYFDRLVRLARSCLGAQVPQRAADAEDVALSAFASFCRRAEQGQLPLLRDRDNLWPLLALITVRKAAELARQERRQKRGGGKVRGESAWLEVAGADAEEAGIEQVLEQEPTPAAAVAAAEECRRMLDSLADPSLRSVALWKLEGYSNEEIAARLGVVTRTVERKLRAIRQIWGHEESNQ